MIQTEVHIVATRDIRDRVMLRPYKVVRRFPGGREIVIRKARSRAVAVQRAFQTRSQAPDGFVAEADAVVPEWQEPPLKPGESKRPMY